jgi:hypothetical protein
VFSNLENKTISNDIAATRYIDNNIMLFEEYSQEDINKEHNKLKNFIDETVVYIDNQQYDLYAAIGNLIYESLNKKNPNVDLIHESFVIVLENMKKDKTKEVIKEEKSFDLPKEIDSELLIEHAFNKYKEKYSTLTESETELVKKLAFSLPQERKKMFENLKKENISILESTDKTGIEDKIHGSIDKIQKMPYNESTVIKDIMSLYELKNNIS